MYIWNINKLVISLQEGTITNKQKKRYRIFFWVIFTLSVLAYPVVYNPSTMNGYDVIDLIFDFNYRCNCNLSVNRYL